MRQAPWTQHDRNVNAAEFNFKNLIMPAARGRSGGGRDAVPLHEDAASPQGHSRLGHGETGYRICLACRTGKGTLAPE